MADRATELLLRHLDGRTTLDEAAAVERLLRTDADAVDRLITLSVQRTLLAERLGEAAAAESIDRIAHDAEPDGPALSTDPRPSRVAAWGAVAAVALLAATIVITTRPTDIDTPSGDTAVPTVAHQPGEIEPRTVAMASESRVDLVSELFGPAPGAAVTEAEPETAWDRGPMLALAGAEAEPIGLDLSSGRWSAPVRSDWPIRAAAVESAAPPEPDLTPGGIDLNPFANP